MKKLLLMLMTGSIALSANAQDNTSILFTKPMNNAKANAHQLSAQEVSKMHQAMSQKFSSNSSARTTATHVDTWYNLWEQNFTDPTSGGISVGYYYATYPDSNVLDNTGTTSYHTYCHGLGMSFDPTDSSYSYTNVNGGSCQIPIIPAMTISQTYMIDSFYAPVVYMRNNTSATDSIIIEIAVTPASSASTDDSGAYALKFNSSPTFTEIAYDLSARFATAHYNSGCGMRPAPYNAEPYVNDIYFDSVFTKKYHYGFELNSTTVADTDANGFLDFTKLATGAAGTGALPIVPITDINSSNQYVVSFVKFKSGVANPLGTLIGAANWIKLFAGEPTGASTWFMQSAANSGSSYAGSYQDGLIAQNQIRYSDSSFTFPSGTHDILIPSYAFSNSPTSTASGFDVTEQSFHVVYDNGPVSTTINKTINTVNAYPNPAANQVNVSYSLTNNANVTVTLTNMIGQVVATQAGVNGKATFATSTLADGMYIYTVQANGERTTGHVAIAH